MWLSYAAYYFGRRGFAAVKKLIEQDLGISATALGLIDTAYLTAYSIGQFVSGRFGDRIGARRLVGYGMLASALACAAFGSMSGAIAFGLLFTVNGFAQATGWPGTTRGMADWTTNETRGSAMGIFSTCYQVGGFTALWFAGFLASFWGWRSAFFGPALVMIAVALAVLAFYPTPPLASSGITTETAPEEVESERRKAQLAVVKNPMIWFFAASYFFVKVIRYALLFWLPYYLSTTLGYSTREATGIASAFDAGGFVGVVVIGVLSDRSKRFGRAVLAALGLVGLALACGAYMRWGGAGILANIALLALIGAMLFGPDSILCGAAAMDAGGPRAASMATGFVNGVGSVGPVLQGLLVPPFALRYGWQALFPAFVVLSLCAALALVPALVLARARGASSGGESA